MIQKDSAGLRDVLFDELVSLREGNSTPARARAMAAIAQAILDSVTTEIAYHAAQPIDGPRIVPIPLAIEDKRETVQ